MTAASHIEIYRTDDGRTRIEVRLEQDTLWLSQAQVAELFEKDSDTIGLHLKNIYAEGELEEAATTEESSVVRQEGKRQVRRTIRLDNLDAAISFGYRVNSRKGTQSRTRAATERLREYLVEGYAVNRQRFEQNVAELEQALARIRKAARSLEPGMAEGRGLVEIIGRYTQTFLWLRRYDDGLLEDPDGQPGGAFLFRRLPAPQRPAPERARRGRRQRHRACGRAPFGGRIRSEAEGDADPADREHAGGGPSDP